ncbi:MAG: GNAT family N-acetyltransferase [Thomasclavelia sp.]|nr:GNAT family N-acetyltransferase [Thomasclavelia sp.]
MKLIKAKQTMYQDIINLYEDIIVNTPTMNEYGRWKKDLYPTKEIIKEYLDNDSLYVVLDNNKIIAGVGLTMFQTEEYHNIKWDKELKDNEVLVVHILGISPKHQNQGLASTIIDDIKLVAKENKMKAIRLDALESNKPAHHVYLNNGFKYHGLQNLYACNVGDTNFYYFEYLL